MQVDLEQFAAMRWRAQSAFAATQSGLAAVAAPAPDAADVASPSTPVQQPEEEGQQLQQSGQQQPGRQRSSPASQRLQSPSPGGAGSGGILQRLGGASLWPSQNQWLCSSNCA